MGEAMTNFPHDRHNNAKLMCYIRRVSSTLLSYPSCGYDICTDYWKRLYWDVDVVFVMIRVDKLLHPAPFCNLQCFFRWCCTLSL